MKPTKISQKGINLIKKYEGFYSKPYLCPAGVPTIGYGTTFNRKTGKRVSLSDKPITEREAEELLRLDLDFFEKGVDRYTRDDISQHQFDALVSFAYNVGLGNLQRSTLLRKINNNPKEKGIVYQFTRWNRANGRILRGLTKRRQDEANLYFS